MTSKNSPEYPAELDFSSIECNNEPFGYMPDGDNKPRLIFCNLFVLFASLTALPIIFAALKLK